MDALFSVNFLDNRYELPGGLIDYIIMAQQGTLLFSEISNRFIEKSKLSSPYAIDKDAMDEDFIKISEYFVTNLCSKNIFDYSVQDFMVDNPAYKKFLEITHQAHMKHLENLRDAVDNYTSKYNESLNKASASVTGSGVTLYSNSLSMLSASAIVESGIISRQTEKANALFKAEMKLNSMKVDGKLQQQDAEYLINIYNPAALSTFNEYIAYCIYLYFDIHFKTGLLGDSILAFTQYTKSCEILQNVSLTTDISSVLKSAFIKCPYNIQIFIEAIKHDFIDANMIETIRKLKQYDLIHNITISKVQSLEISSQLFSVQLNELSVWIKSVALMDGTSYDESYDRLIQYYRTKLETTYQTLGVELYDNTQEHKDLWSIIHKEFNQSDFDLIIQIKNYIIKLASDNTIKTLYDSTSQDLANYHLSLTIGEKLSKKALDEYYADRALQANYDRIKTLRKNKEAEDQRIEIESKNQKINKIFKNIGCLFLVLGAIFLIAVGCQT